MEKYGVLKEYTCTHCGKSVIVSLGTKLDTLEKTAELADHNHTWKERIEDGTEKSSDVRSE